MLDTLLFSFWDFFVKKYSSDDLYIFVMTEPITTVKRILT